MAPRHRSPRGQGSAATVARGANTGGCAGGAERPRQRGGGGDDSGSGSAGEAEEAEVEEEAGVDRRRRARPAAGAGCRQARALRGWRRLERLWCAQGTRGTAALERASAPVRERVAASVADKLGPAEKTDAGSPGFQHISNSS